MLMDKVEREFKKIMLDNFTNKYKFEVFQKSNTNIYSAMLSTIRMMLDRNINTEYPVMLDSDITKIRLSKQRKIYYFLGVFSWKGKEVALFGKTSTFGTVYLEDTTLVKKMREWNKGMKMGLELDENDKPHIVLPMENPNIGLFESE